jgi:predicted MFS family arabinose efflux permease
VKRLHRDRLTWLTYCQLGSYGYFLYGFGPTVSLLRDEQGISRTLSGLHGTALALGSLLSALLTAPLIRRRGRGPVMWGGLVVMCVGIVLYVATDVLALTLTGALLCAFGGTFVVVPVAAVLTDHHRAAGPAAITEANAVAAGVGTVAPLVVGLTVAVGLGWRPAMLLLLPVVALIGLLGARVRYPSPSVEPERHAGSNRLPRVYWIGWAVVTAGIAVEFCMTLWTADILRARYGLSPAMASAGVTAIIAGIFIGRVGGGRLALHVAVDRLLYGALTVCAIGFATFWLTTWAPVAIAGLLVCGAGIALLYPLGLARVIDLSDGRPDLATARVGIGASIAAGGGPFVLGALSDQVGIHGAFLVVPVLLVVSAVGLRLLGTPRPTARLAAA